MHHQLVDDLPRDSYTLGEAPQILRGYCIFLRPKNGRL